MSERPFDTEEADLVLEAARVIHLSLSDAVRRRILKARDLPRRGDVSPNIYDQQKVSVPMYALADLVAMVEGTLS